MGSISLNVFFKLLFGYEDIIYVSHPVYISDVNESAFPFF